MKTSDFFYELPQELIAQKPIEDRASSRLLVVHRTDSGVEHRRFSDILEYFNPGDALVLNDTQVFKARLIGQKKTGAKIELFLLKYLGNSEWEALIKPAKRVKLGEEIEFAGEKINMTLLEDVGDGIRRVRLRSDEDIDSLISEHGDMPLPPYIKSKLAKEEEGRYQTVYASKKGSVAAPTAGLHFTENLLSEIRKKGIDIINLTLHVGIGTFRPVQVDNVEDHIMHSEHYILTQDAADRINACKARGAKLFSVGTTSTRVLESVYKKYGEIRADTGETDIFIFPGYEFKTVDALITNFHLPESTLLMLVSAFYDRERMLDIYKLAAKNKYRFFSFGDAMLIL